MDAQLDTAEVPLVEDSKEQAFLTKMLFKKCCKNVRVTVVEDGRQALDYLNRKNSFETAPPPDLILLDLNLPELDGREVLRQIKASSQLRRIPVLVLTTSSDRDDITNCYDLHANCFFTKPLDLDDFARLIRRIDEVFIRMAKHPPAKQESA